MFSQKEIRSYLHLIINDVKMIEKKVLGNPRTEK